MTAGALACAAWQVFGARGPFGPGVALLEAAAGLESARTVELLDTWATALMRVQRLDDAERAIDELARRHGDLPEHRELLGRLAVRRGDGVGARPLLASAVAAYRAAGSTLAEARARVALAQVDTDLRRYDEAIAGFDGALVELRRLGDRTSEARALGELAQTLREAGRVPEAIRAFEAAIAFDRAHSLWVSAGSALGNLGGLQHTLGALDEALACYRESLELDRRLGSRVGEGIALGNTGRLALLAAPLGALDPAEAARGRDALEQALAIHREIGFTYGLPYWLAGLARLEAATGGDGEALAAEALALAENASPRLCALLDRATIRILAGRVDEAREDLDRAAELAPDGPDVDAGHALVATLTGASDGAERVAKAQAGLDRYGIGLRSRAGRFLERARRHLA